MGGWRRGIVRNALRSRSTLHEIVCSQYPVSCSHYLLFSWMSLRFQPSLLAFNFKHIWVWMFAFESKESWLDFKNTFYSITNGFSSGHVRMWELDCEEGWALSTEELMLLNYGVGEDSWESLGLQGDPPIHSKGDQPWDFFGRNDAKAESPVLWPPHEKSLLIGKDSDAMRDWGQEEKGTTEDEMAGWHHWLNECKSEWTPGVGDGQGGLAWCDSWGCKELDTTERLNWTDTTLMSHVLPANFVTRKKILDWKITQFIGWMIAVSQDICCSVPFTSKGWVPLPIHSTDPACFQTYTSHWLLDNPALQPPYLQSWIHHLSLLFYFCFLT